MLRGFSFLDSPGAIDLDTGLEISFPTQANCPNYENMIPGFAV